MPASFDQFFPTQINWGYRPPPTLLLCLGLIDRPFNSKNQTAYYIETIYVGKNGSCPRVAPTATRAATPQQRCQGLPRPLCPAVARISCLHRSNECSGDRGGAMVPHTSFVVPAASGGSPRGGRGWQHPAAPHGASPPVCHLRPDSGFPGRFYLHYDRSGSMAAAAAGGYPNPATSRTWKLRGRSRFFRLPMARSVPCPTGLEMAAYRRLVVLVGSWQILGESSTRSGIKQQRWRRWCIATFLKASLGGS